MSDKLNILVLPGSIRTNSLCEKLINAFRTLAPEEIEFNVADLSKIPLYNQDLELPEPDFLIEFKSHIKPADGILMITPEYNRSIPPVLKNALDWASRPWAPYEERSMFGKPAGIATYTPYSLGGFGCNHHLRQVLTFLNMPTMQQPEFYLGFATEKFDQEGKLIDDSTKEHIIKFWNNFIPFIKKFKNN